MAHVEGACDLERQEVISLMIEIVANADVVGNMADGTTLYILHLSAPAADTLASLFSDSEGDEHDGKEPEKEE